MLWNKQKVAVIGGGTAGFMCAAQISKQYPGCRLYHIYDSRIPNIGVGEGTLPTFPPWIKEITGLPFQMIEERLNATRKVGIGFEGWGKKHDKFIHRFTPPEIFFGYHLSAHNVIDLLGDYINAQHIDAYVRTLESSGQDVRITFEDNSELLVDFVLDARGFPRQLDETKHFQFDFIPTNAAVVRRGPANAPGSVVSFAETSFTGYVTRAVARPHGWLFVIPLTSHSSYGYIFNKDINSESEIEADFDRFMAEDGVVDYTNGRLITFPNFIHQEIFDGSLFRVGNGAGFLEPLEATALGLIQKQLYTAAETAFPRLKVERVFNARVIDAHIKNWALSSGVFIAWHYAMGSKYETPFWRHAQSCWYKCVEMLQESDPLHGLDFKKNGQRFQEFLQQGKIIQGELPSEIDPATIPFYGAFPAASFYDVGYGMGYYQEVAEGLLTRPNSL